MAKRVKSAPISIYVAPELKAAAEKTAAKDARTLTGLIEKLIIDAAMAAGFWPPKGKPRK
jgi:hypothetical protein